MDYQIKNENQEFSLWNKEEKIGYLHYNQDQEQDYVVISIFVNETYRGNGYAKILLDEFIEKARKENKKITPICTYAQKQFEKRKEIGDVLEKQK